MTIEKDLPQGWAFTKVEAIADLLRGISYKKDQASKEPMLDYKPVLRANNINGSLNFEDLVYVPASLINDEQFIKAGDIVFAMSSGSKHLVGKSARALSAYDGSYGAFCALLRPIDSISKDYIYYIFQSNDFRRRISETATGTNINNLKREHILDFEFPIPPLNEQKRIVAKIEALFAELDAGVASLELAQAQLQTYRQALLKHAFEGKLTAQWRTANADKVEDAETLLQRIKAERQARHEAELAVWKEEVKTWVANGKPGKKPTKPTPPKDLPPLTPAELADLPQLPAGWEWMKLGNLNVEISDGPFGSNLKTKDYVEEGVRVIRLENIGELEFIHEKETYISDAKYETLKKHTVSSGDIIFASFITESTRVVVIPPSIKKAINKADCFLVRLHGNSMRNDFLATFLSTRFVFRYLEELVHGVGRPRINTTQLKNVPVPVISSMEQAQITDTVKSELSITAQLEQTITTALQQAEALRQSILKKAFAGQLVPQDPNDEPASALLARIRAAKS